MCEATSERSEANKDLSNLQMKTMSKEYISTKVEPGAGAILDTSIDVESGKKEVTGKYNCLPPLGKELQWLEECMRCKPPQVQFVQITNKGNRRYHLLYQLLENIAKEWSCALEAHMNSCREG
jgi:hypothetical protein